MLIIYALLFGLTIYFLFFNKTKKPQDKENKETKKSKKQSKTENDANFDISNKSVQKESVIETEKDKSKKKIINSFREGKEICNYLFAPDQSYITFHDEKKFCLVYLNNPLDRDIKRYSKNVELDIISHCHFDPEQKKMAVSLKNSKEVLFYYLTEEGGKTKFVKSEKKISTERKYEIKRVATTGSFIVTTGIGEDTLVQVYEQDKGKLVFSSNTNEIENLEMRLSPDCNFITITTYLNEISIFAIVKSSHHIKNSSLEEVSYKVIFYFSVKRKIPLAALNFQLFIMIFRIIKIIFSLSQITIK